MNAPLKLVQEISAQHLVDNFDPVRGFALRARGSHTDLWPGDPWVQAYSAIGRTDLAELSFDAVMRSIRPDDGSVPHLMQGSHIRRGRETNMIDLMVYAATGIGITKSRTNEWVTRLHAQPGWATSAEALYRQKLQTRGEMNATGFARGIMHTLVDATQALYKARGTEKGVIVAAHRDEMTNRSGALAHVRKPVLDPSVNAMLVQNNQALRRLAAIARFRLPQDLLSTMNNTSGYLTGLVTEQIKTETPYLPEYVLAAARIGMKDISSEVLQSVYAVPSRKDKHPEKKHLSTAECVEIARLTLNQPDSQAYLDRYVTSIAEGQPITRFIGSVPTDNPIDNKYHRRQPWLPTDAQLVLVPAA